MINAAFDAKKTILFWLIIYIFFPVITLSGHFINFPELYTFLLFILNIKKIQKLQSNATTKIFIGYFVAFFIIIILTATMANTRINNHDIFILRNIIQLVIAFYLFDLKLSEVIINDGINETRTFFIKTVTLISIPSFIVFLQRINLFSLNSLIDKFYAPQFFFLKAQEFIGFRYTSVFKDFFTASVYLTTVALLIFYLLIKKDSLSTKRKLTLLVLLLSVYGSLMFVARTGIILTPIFAILLLLLSGGGARSILKKVVILFLIVTPLLLFIITLAKYEIINSNWITEGFTGQNSSFEVMQKWYEISLNYIQGHPEMLLSPAHEYTLTVTANPLLYSDSFYIQEIFRYGIYGITVYFIFVSTLLISFIKRNIFLAVLVISFIVMNYKGGNVFFMAKNIYLYAYLFVAVEKLYPKNSVSVGNASP